MQIAGLRDCQIVEENKEVRMATSSIKRNFVIEGQDAEDFANSLDEAFKEREERGAYIPKGVYVSNPDEIKKSADRIFKNV